MPFKLGLISDVHATPAPLREALSLFRREEVDLVLCAGDVAGYGRDLLQTVELLVENDCRTILGNHDVWLLDSPGKGRDTPVDSFFKNLPAVWESVIEGKQVYAVHASPLQSMSRGISLRDVTERIMPARIKQWADELGEYAFDVLIVGHTHQIYAEKLGDILVINPGSTKFNHTCAILSLPDMDVRFFPLSNKVPRKFWHWGMMTAAGPAAGQSSISD